MTSASPAPASVREEETAVVTAVSTTPLVLCLHMDRAAAPARVGCAPLQGLKARGDECLIPLLCSPVYRFGPWMFFFQFTDLAFSRKLHIYRFSLVVHAYNKSQTVHRIKMFYICKMLRISFSFIICYFHPC